MSVGRTVESTCQVILALPTSLESALNFRGIEIADIREDTVDL